MHTQPYMVQGPQLRIAWLLWSLPSITTSLLQRQGTAASQGVDPYDFQSGAPPPNGHFEPESGRSAKWPRERQKFRKRLLSSSERHAAELKAMSGDDIVKVVNGTDKDSFLWGPLSDFKEDDTSLYWNDLCNGTNMSKNNTLPGDAPKGKLDVSVVLAKWQLVKDNTCTELVSDTVYTDALEAFKKCAAVCDGLSYTQSSPTANATIQLCALGGFRQTVNATAEAAKSPPGAMKFVYNKPADFVSPKGQPRPPVEIAFWKTFCAYRQKGRSLRIMFEGQNCADANVKAVDKPTNPVECAEAIAKDADCAKEFDFKFGPPAACRCLKTNLTCDPKLSDHGNVYAPSLE